MYILLSMKAYCLVLNGFAPLALLNVTVSRLWLFLVRVTSDSGAVEREMSPRGHCGVVSAVVAASVVYVAHCWPHSIVNRGITMSAVPAVYAVILRTFCQQDSELECIVTGALEALCRISKSQSCPYARHEGVCGSGGIGTHILERGARRRWVVGWTHRWLSPSGRAPGVHWVGGWVGHNRSGRAAGENALSCTCRELNCDSLVVRSLVTILTELSRRLRRRQSNQGSDRADLCGLTGGAWEPAEGWVLSVLSCWRTQRAITRTVM
jgi:hypothetical protein